LCNQEKDGYVCDEHFGMAVVPENRKILYNQNTTTDGFILRTINPWQSSDIIFTFTYVKLVEQELLALLEYLSSPSRFYVVSVAHVQLVEQELLALLEYLSSPPRFYMVSVAHVQLV
jgi:hypothetical protein